MNIYKYQIKPIFVGKFIISSFYQGDILLVCVVVVVVVVVIVVVFVFVAAAATDAVAVVVVAVIITRPFYPYICVSKTR